GNRVLARPEPSRERIINNGDLLGLQTILFCELTSAKQRNPHCSEIARRHQIYRGFDLFSSRKRRLSFYREIRCVRKSIDKDRAYCSSRLDARHRFDAFDELTKECVALRTLIPRSRQLNVH